MTEAKKKAPGDRLQALSGQYLSESKLVMQRNMAFGTAGVCFLVLVLLGQITLTSVPLQVSAVGAAIGMPLWILLGSLYEIYVALGRKSYVHFRRPTTQNALGFVSLMAAAALLAAIGGLIFHLSHWIALAFGVAIVVAMLIYIVFIERMGKWWYSAPDATDSDEPQA